MSEKSSYLKSDFYQLLTKKSQKNPINLNHYSNESNDSSYIREGVIINPITSREKKSRLFSLKKRISISKSPGIVLGSTNLFQQDEEIIKSPEEKTIKSNEMTIISKNHYKNSRSHRGITRLLPRYIDNDVSPILKPMKNLNTTENQRIQTPTFLNNNECSMQELQEMCEKLAIEQNIMKDQINNQHNIITKLNLNHLPLYTKQHSAGVERESLPRSRTMLKRKFPIENSEKEIVSESLKYINSNKFPSLNSTVWTSSTKNSPRDLQQEGINAPFIFCKKSDLTMTKKLNRMKYYKDQPKIMKNSRFPKDIFVVKN